MIISFKSANSLLSEVQLMRKIFLLAFLLCFLALSSVRADLVSSIEKSGTIPGLASETVSNSPEGLPILFGIIIIGDTKKAILYNPNTNERITVEEGDSVAGYKVEKILPDEVIVSSEKHTYHLTPFSKEAAEKRRFFARVRISKAPSVSSKLSGKNVLRSERKASRIQKAPVSVNANRREIKRVESQPSNSLRKESKHGFFPISFNKRARPSQNPFLKLLRRLK